LITSMEGNLVVQEVALLEVEGTCIHEDNVQLLVEEDRRVNKRDKKKSNRRPPLCTFFNYLDSPADATLSNSPDGQVIKTPTAMSETERTITDNSGDDADDDPLMMESNRQDDIVMTVSDSEIVVVTDTPSPLPVPVESMDDHQVHRHDDSASVETVNTSNKSVDILYLRPDSGSFEKNIPALVRWKKPLPPMTDKLMLDLDALYVTSRCESDDDDEEQTPISRPIREIVVKTRRRLPSLQSQWRTQHSKRYCLG
jgi:hypothetical protein